MKNTIKKILNYFGYKVIRVKRDSKLNFAAPFEMQKRLTLNLDSNIVIFDVGAHFGESALKYNDVFPESTIYCFEPFPESFDELKRTIVKKDRIKAYNLGLSDYTGVANFYSNASSATNSLLKTDPDAKDVWGDKVLEFKGNVNVNLTTLDEFVQSHRIENIDILKLDVQGAEYKVLKGGEKTLMAGVVKLLYTEIILSKTYEGQFKLSQLLELYNNFGFELFGIYDFSHSKSGQIRQFDAIFKFNEGLL
jgi:FkbM family methyltransferase